jgi:hypothetical protein
MTYEKSMVAVASYKVLKDQRWHDVFQKKSRGKAGHCWFGGGKRSWEIGIEGAELC